MSWSITPARTVTVESPYGTRRISPISHVRPADPADPSRPATSRPATSPPTASPPTPQPTPQPAAQSAPATQRWQHLFAAAHPDVLTDPHWPALAAQLDRVAATGADVADLVASVTADRDLPADHPARSLDYRLANAAAPAPTARPGDAPPPATPRPSPPADLQQLRPRCGPTR